MVALPGIGHMPKAGEDEQDEARLFYVAATRATRATRATHKLLVTVSKPGGFGLRLDRSLTDTATSSF